MTAAREKPPLYRWRDAIKSSDGPRSPILRLVLLILADWSTKDGSRATPAISVLAEQTGLSERTVRERLKQADGVWFARTKRGRGYNYSLLIPPSDTQLPTVTELRNGRSAIQQVQYRNDATRHRNEGVANSGAGVPARLINLSKQQDSGVIARSGKARSRLSVKQKCSRAGCSSPVHDPEEGQYCQQHLEVLIRGGAL